MGRPSEVALTYLGQEETPGNSGFVDKAFEADMIAEEWQRGWAWCAVFARLVFVKAYPERADELRKLFDPSAVETYKNFKKAAYPMNIVPKVDYLVIWQRIKEGRPTWMGHAGIITKVTSSWEFESIEGNSNSEGGREGKEVALVQRRIFAKVTNGLKVLAFIKI